MSASLELQGAIVGALGSDPALMSLVSGIYDRVPPQPWGAVGGYISFGPESTLTSASDCAALDDVSLQIDIWSRQVGRVHCKQVIHEVQRVMASLATTKHRIVARSEPFVQILQDPDGLTTHGVMRYEFGIERRIS